MTDICACGCGKEIQHKEWHKWDKKTKRYLPSHTSKCIRDPVKRREHFNRYNIEYQSRLVDHYCSDCGKQMSWRSKQRGFLKCQKCAIKDTRRANGEYTAQEYSSACKLINYYGLSVKNVPDDIMDSAVKYIKALKIIKGKDKYVKSKL